MQYPEDGKQTGSRRNQLEDEGIHLEVQKPERQRLCKSKRLLKSPSRRPEKGAWRAANCHRAAELTAVRLERRATPTFQVYSRIVSDNSSSSNDCHLLRALLALAVCKTAGGHKRPSFLSYALNLRHRIGDPSTYKPTLPSQLINFSSLLIYPIRHRGGRRIGART